MTIPLRTLLVDDSEHDGKLMLEALRWENYEPQYVRVETGLEMKAALPARALCQPGFLPVNGSAIGTVYRKSPQ